jgi:hypothetical protein
MVIASIVAAASGCASAAVSSDSIEKNTATTLGLTKDQFTISDREDVISVYLGMYTAFSILQRVTFVLLRVHSCTSEETHINLTPE